MRIVLSVGFFIGFLSSGKLWLSERFFPLTPVASFLPTITAPFDYIFLITLLLLLVLVVFLQKPSPYVIAFTLLAVFYALFDQSRWLAPFYQYTLMFIVLCLYPWKISDSTGRIADQTLTAWRIIIAGIYFWSGINKINPLFFIDVVPWLAEPTVALVPEFLRGLVYALVSLGFLWEMLAGILLLTDRFRKMGIFLAVTMHAFIIFTVGPFGHDWQIIIWYWNAIMVVFVVILFGGVSRISLRETVFTRKFIGQKIIIALVAVAPVLHLFNLWDYHLSFDLYSGNSNTALFYLSSTTINTLPVEIKKYIRTDKNKESVLNVVDWFEGEFNGYPYTEKRIFRNLLKNFCTYETSPGDVRVVFKERDSLLKGNQVPHTYTCSSPL